jgi:glycosyltransferase involved in cell wall biosynthesis
MSGSVPTLLFLVNTLGVGGAEKQVVSLLNQMDTRRFRLRLAYLRRNEQLLPRLRREQLDGLDCLEESRLIDWAAVRRLRRLIDAADVDAIVCTNSYSTLYGQLARGARGSARLVTAFHTTRLRSLKEKAQMLLYRRLFNRCDLMLYVCESQRRYWRERGVHPKSDAVVHNGIDTEWYTDLYTEAQKLAVRRSLQVRGEDYLVGLCSTLRPEKAHTDLLRAIARLRTRGIPATALLIGDGPERTLIERTAVQLGIAGHVRITGMKEDVRPFISACDVMTLVSHSIETFSLAALESMSLGKPLVMSDLGGAGEQVSHGSHGFLFEPGDIAALAHHLTTLTSAPLRAELGAAAARRVRERYTVQLMTERFTECLASLLDGRAPPARRAGAELTA